MTSFLLVLAFPILGAACTKLLLGWNRTLELVFVGVGLGLVLFLFLLNLGLRVGWLLDDALLVGSIVAWILAAGIAAGALQNRPLLRPEPADRWDGLLAVGACFVFYLTNGAQLSVVDNDYWLHAALQGHMLRGEFPPRNPFFSEFLLGGHYGRDLLIVGAARLLRLDLIHAQWLMTSLCHATSFAVYALAIRRFCVLKWAPLMSAIFLWLGINVGYMSGLLQFFENNGTLVYLQLALCLAMVLEVWERPTISKVVLLGVSAGTYAFVYETHFGLLLLSTTAVSGLLWFWGEAPRRRGVLSLAVAWSLALGLASFHGGVFSDLAARGLSTSSNVGLSTVTNQSQRVQIRFPKENIFEMRIGVDEGQLVSLPYSSALFLPFYTAMEQRVQRTDPVYTPIWSWTALKMHWLGLLLAPISIVVLCKRRETCGLLFLSFGLFAWLIPGLVDFGPVHELEYLRWEAAAGVGCSVALGITLAVLVELKRPMLVAISLTLALANTFPGWGYLGRSFAVAVSQGSLWNVLSLDRSSSAWLMEQSDFLNLRETDLEALTYLSRAAKPGERVLVNFSESNPWGIVFESTLASLTGLYPAGHSLPLPEDPIGLPPSRILGPYRDFLRDPNSGRLKILDIDWLYIRVDPERAPYPDYARVPELEQVLERRESGGGVLRLFRVHGH